MGCKLVLFHTYCSICRFIWKEGNECGIGKWPYAQLPPMISLQLIRKKWPIPNYSWQLFEFLPYYFCDVTVTVIGSRKNWSIKTKKHEFYNEILACKKRARTFCSFTQQQPSFKSCKKLKVSYSRVCEKVSSLTSGRGTCAILPVYLKFRVRHITLMKSLRNRSNIYSGALRNYKLYTCYPSRCVSTVVGVTEEVDANLADEKKSVDSCFPWRSSPTSVRLPFAEVITHHVCGTLINDVHFNKESQIAARFDK